MRRYLAPLAGGIVLGAAAVWLFSSVLALTTTAAVHPPGAGQFGDWTGPKEAFLHIYLWLDESAGCPTAINVVPTDEAAEIWKKLGAQPKRIVWKIRERNDADRWTIQTKPGTDDFMPAPPDPKVIPAGPDDAFWTEKSSPFGPPTVDGQKEYWKWMYEVTVQRDGCGDPITLDPPVYIRRK